MIPSRDTLAYLRVHRERILVSLASFLIVAVAFPKILPGWAVKVSGGGLGIQQLVAARGEEKLLTGAVCAIGYIDKALRTTAEERELIETEHDAFQSFAREVQSIPVQQQQMHKTGSVPIAEAVANNQQLETVRNCYRDTVMAVPDYEEEYGETLREHLTAEFNADLASIVIDGSQLTQPAQQLLVQQAQLSAMKREDLLDLIDNERESLTESHPQLRQSHSLLAETPVKQLPQRSFDELLAYECRLRAAKDRHETLADTRQEAVQMQYKRFHRSDGLFLQEYLYRNHDFTFPVLSAVVERIKQLSNRRKKVIRSLSRRN